MGLEMGKEIKHTKKINEINMSKKDESELQKKSTILNIKIKKLKKAYLQMLKEESHEG